ncbi:hypothetical protein CPC08DRAFT_754472 [Agrocybe pediades]|nr:hypothetical protein CPC08DRAFT_754472 [Agrocybe pediades]
MEPPATLQINLGLTKPNGRNQSNLRRNLVPQPQPTGNVQNLASTLHPPPTITKESKNLRRHQGLLDGEHWLEMALLGIKVQGLQISSRATNCLVQLPLSHPATTKPLSSKTHVVVVRYAFNGRYWNVATAARFDQAPLHEVEVSAYRGRGA